MKKYKIIIYLILLFSASCKSQNNNTAKIKEDTSQAKILNNLALKISELSCNKDSIEKSIRLIEEAIKLDSTVPLYYRNEAQMYCLLKKYQDAIKVLNRYLLYNINSPLETLKGFIFEKTENMDSAMCKFR